MATQKTIPKTAPEAISETAQVTAKLQANLLSYEQDLATRSTSLLRALTGVVAGATQNNRAQRRALASEVRAETRAHVREQYQLIQAVRDRHQALAEEEAKALRGARVAALKTEQVQQLRDSGQLRALLNRHAGSTAEALEQAIVRGVYRDARPEQVRRQLVSLVGGDLASRTGLEARLALIARTELLRVERGTLLAVWEEEDAVIGWQWKSRLSTNTCALCYAMHGAEFYASEPFATHPGCQCIPVPILKNSKRKLLAPGPYQFERLSAETQREILGPTRYAMYTAGTLTLDDNPVTGVTEGPRDSDWGPVQAVRPLSAYASAPAPV